RVFLPFEWTGVELFAAGGTELRVRVDLDASGTSARIWVADPAGGPVAYVDGLQIREASAEQVRGAATVDHLYRVDHQEVQQSPSSAEAGRSAVLGGNGDLARLLGVDHLADADVDADELPGRTLVDLTGWAGRPVHEALADVLALVQRLVDEPGELVFVTRGAVAGEPVQAALAGFVRTVRAEYQDRAIRLLDLDTNADADTIARALLADGEPELAVIGGRVTAPRLVRVSAADASERVVLDPERTVLVTGGTGELG
ncbi:hypothetical protein VM95_37795, partial [Streptomyces rubellomurinus]